MPPSPSSLHSLLLHSFFARSIERCHREVKLVCRLLCIENSSVSTGRALLIPAAIMHKVVPASLSSAARVHFRVPAFLVPPFRDGG